MLGLRAKVTTRPIAGRREQPGGAGFAAGRAVVVIAVHHVRVGDIDYTGGAEKFILQSVRALLDAGARVHVGYSGSSIYDDLLDRFHPDRLTVERTEWIDDVMAGDRSLAPRLVIDRARWFRASGADTALFVQQASGAAFVASVAGARLAGLRVVSTLRQPTPGAASNEDGRSVARGWRQRRMSRRQRRPAQLSHLLIYNSETVAEAYERELSFPARKRCVIRNGARVADAIDPAAVPRRFGTVGRLTEAKGVLDLLAAFERVAQDSPSATLALFGNGPLEDALRRRLADAGLTGRVTLMGHVADRRQIFGAFDVYVHASHRESMSNSVIEAMARGLPCVVTDVGGMREAVRHEETGLIVPARDPAALAKAMLRLQRDRMLYERCANGALERARQLFDIRDNAPRLVRAVLGLPES